MRYLVLLLLVAQTGCAYSQRGSDEWWYDRTQRDTRAQCNTLPAELKAQCLQQAQQSYEEFKKQQQH
ncbi:hypothetical protein ACFO3I_07845 [Rheinheimera marina]|uniref:Lipoprotein n=1 Tax=Rheinheimera marina TaxID=1774958 RepID=A0ABV9JKY0_9GAMM